tara:strand:+ start:277 stop:576 length:300 start_codon:yes stop_codon:yes gene_type:complete
MRKLILPSILFFLSTSVFADCVFGAKDKTSYKIIETGYGAKIYFSGGYSSDFIIELSAPIYGSYIDEIYFLKDDFCDYESEVIVIDEEVFDVLSVTEIN